MTLYLHELKLGRTALFIWTGSIGAMLVVCMLMFPEMKNEIDTVNDMFANMGSFTSAFKMDQINFGEAMGFYAIECGNVLGIGGAFYAAMLGIGILSKEEKEHTAEFLLSHPISRVKTVGQKLLAVVSLITIMNLVITGLAVASFLVIEEEIVMPGFLLVHLAYYLMQLEIAGICFGISAFVRRGGVGIGIGIATGMYFLNIIANISGNVKFLKYITPFGFAEASDILAESSIDGIYLAIGMLITLAGIAAAFYQYCKKDIFA